MRDKGRRFMQAGPPGRLTSSTTDFVAASRARARCSGEPTCRDEASGLETGWRQSASHSGEPVKRVLYPLASPYRSTRGP